MNLLVIDIGTSSMRGILFDERGKRLGVHQVKYQTIKYGDGRVEQNPRDWISALEKISAEIVKASDKAGKAVDAVAVTAQRSAVIPVDRQGEPLMNAIMWQDQRNAGICRDLESRSELIFRRTGASINTVFSGSRMTWIMENCPETVKNLYKFVNIPEYVMHYMTGEYKTDATYGSRSHLMSLRDRKWDQEMLEIFRVEEKLLCVIQEPGTVCGRITAEFSRKTGIPSGIPVVTAGGDQQCGAVGQGVFQEGSLSLVTGTGAFLSAPLSQIPENLSPKLICGCSSVKNHYMVEANVITCCSAFDWFCRSFYDWEGDTDYGRIDRELAALENIVGRELVLPYFQGRSTPEWNPHARAVFSEISLSTERNGILKALLEGIFFEIQNNINLFSNYTQIEKAFISGGLTNSSRMNQLQADIYGIPLYCMQDSEATALGALMIALQGMGVYKDISDAFGAVCGHIPVKCYTPNPELHSLYEEKRQRMNELYREICGR
ncbi:MAG TPA: hypothetical protein IAB84_05570 [Candidatus Choladousia intestinigallinarum]|nr:hypothetical protein [Candidatus Choladousia intestinigallinarum]